MQRLSEPLPPAPSPPLSAWPPVRGGWPWPRPPARDHGHAPCSEADEAGEVGEAVETSQVQDPLASGAELEAPRQGEKGDEAEEGAGDALLQRAKEAAMALHAKLQTSEAQREAQRTAPFEEEEQQQQAGTKMEAEQQQEQQQEQQAQAQARQEEAQVQQAQQQVARQKELAPRQGSSSPQALLEQAHALLDKARQEQARRL